MISREMLNLWRIAREASNGKQFYVFETMQLNAGTRTWEEQMRVLEARSIFHDRVLILTEQGTSHPKLKLPNHYRVDKR
jgi:hypothetical protein